MFTEENDVAETDETTTTETETVDTGSADTGEAVSSSGDMTAAADESTETAADAPESDDPENAPEVFDWNGEVDALRESDWFQRADMSVKDAVLRGVEAKYRNFERGFTKAFQENAGRRKTLDRRESDIRAQEMRVQKWLHGDVDPLEEKQREIDALKQANDAAILALRDEHEMAVSKMQGGRAGEIEDITKELVEARSRLQTFEAEVQVAREAEDKAELAEFTNWIKEKAPHVYSDHDALYKLCVNVANDVDRDDALAMVLQVHPHPADSPMAPQPVAEPVPAAVGMMNMGTGAAPATESVPMQSFDDMLDKLRRDAVYDENSRLTNS